MSSNHFKLYESLGSLIKDYRERYRLSQETFAGSIGISDRELRRWEANRQRAHIDNLHDLAEFTGMPMQACIALNAGLPIWYRMSQRQFAYSSFEMERSFFPDLSHNEQSGDRLLTRCEPIAADKHVSMILSFYDDFYCMDKLLSSEVIKKAARILPEMNRIVFDCWGHYVGHHICLPLNVDVYQQLKKEASIEGYLTPGRISDIVARQEGVFFFYYIYWVNASIANLIQINNTRYLANSEQKQRYLSAACSATLEAKKHLDHLGMRTIPMKRSGHGDRHAENAPAIHELELDVMLKRLKHVGPGGWMIEKDATGPGAGAPTKKTERRGLPTMLAQKSNAIRRRTGQHVGGKTPGLDPLAVDDPLLVDGSSEACCSDYGGRSENESQKTAVFKRGDLKKEACPNPKCPLYAQKRNAHIVSNGTYRTKEGRPGRRFLCKECGKSFCRKEGAIFHSLRSPEQRILTALKLLVQGMPLRGVAQALDAKLDTVRHWLKVVAEQNGKMDALLVEKLNISQVDLDVLWAYNKENSLHQRARLWKGKL